MELIPNTDPILQEITTLAQQGFQKELLQAYLESPNQATLEKFLDKCRRIEPKVVT